MDEARRLRRSAAAPAGATAAPGWLLPLARLLLLLLSLPGSVTAAAGPPANRTVDFTRDVLPILTSRCGGCHGPEKQRGGLRFDNGAAALRGADWGPVIGPGEGGGSVLVQRVSSHDRPERMPAKGAPLPPPQIAILRAW